jgi:hypothetical protein
VNLAKGLVGKIKLKLDTIVKGKLKVTIDYKVIDLNEDGYEETSCHHLKARASSHRQAKGVEPRVKILTTC